MNRLVLRVLGGAVALASLFAAAPVLAQNDPFCSEVSKAASAVVSKTGVSSASVAVVRDGASAVVFVEVKQGAFARRPVVVGRRSHNEVEIVHGLALGERVVTTGALLLVNALDMGA